VTTASWKIGPGVKKILQETAYIVLPLGRSITALASDKSEMPDEWGKSGPRRKSEDGGTLEFTAGEKSHTAADVTREW